MKFDFDKDIPDLSGKIILVTGGNAGLGKEAIYQLAKHKPAHIYLAARSAAKAQDAIKEIQQRAPDAAPITFLECDLTSFDSIKSAAANFLSQASELHILINNAGIMACPPGVTKEGYEIQFGTNHMGHALLTKLLLPTLLQTAEKAPAEGDVRIVSLSSMGEAFAAKDPYADADTRLKSDLAALSTWTRYGIAKLANVHHSRALAQRYPSLRCVAVHPGAVRTELTRGPLATYAAFSLIVTPLHWLASFALKDVSEGAKNQVWAAVSPEAQSGHFYYPVGVDGKASAQAKDDKLCEQLWARTEKELEAHK
ncbi:hypothetical protein PG994_006427 [Apiospora phragmitis]|uniref:Uncharacterized protein n=1 Tax=Apiospora phragmitis TaxID=2905665 RepID=A0ABR1VF02_9PEZI